MQVVLLYHYFNFYLWWNKKGRDFLIGLEMIFKRNYKLWMQGN